MANKEVNLDSIEGLGISIDDIDDLPGFLVPQPGMYMLKVTASVKEVNNKNSIECKFTTIECLEQNDPEADPTPAGTQFSTLHQIGNEIGMGKFKEIAAPIAKHVGESNLLNLIREHLSGEGQIIQALVKRRADKDDKEKFYADVSKVSIP